MRRDVIVVGAGPAGALAAREIARQGASVLLLDRARFPRPKVCGACLSAGALDELATMGLGDLPDALGAEPLSTLVLSAHERSVRLPLERARAVSRLAFDSALVDAAREEGVDFWSNARAELGAIHRDHRALRVVRGGVGTDLRAGVVLDASGLGGGLAASDARGASVAAGSRIGLGATFRDAGYPVRPGDLHMVVGRGGYVGMVRVESGVLNVAAAVDPHALQGTSPERVIARILASCRMKPLPRERVAEWRGTPLLTRAPQHVGAERLLRLGDAAGYVEPFTGEGMCWAMSGARAVVPLALAGALRWEEAVLDAWREYHRAAVRKARRLCSVLTPALRRPRLVEAALATLSIVPGLAAPLIRRAARTPASLPAYSA
jgi:flavin-dependent dehydrogenase